jgi:hypothetical protein
MTVRKRAGLLLLAWAGSVSAAEIVVPEVAVNVRGKGHNVWSSEIYLVNPSAATARVEIAEVITGRLTVHTPCLPPILQYREVPPRSSALMTWGELSLFLGCPEEYLGALVLRSDAAISVSGRLVNRRGVQVGGEVPPQTGLGQDVPGIPREQLPAPGRTYMLSFLASQPCYGGRFETYLQLANPGDSTAVVTLRRTEPGPSGPLLVDGVLTPFQATLAVDAGRFRQVLVALPPECGVVPPPPPVFDLFVTVDHELAITASVVDRVTQDARTVLPLPP